MDFAFGDTTARSTLVPREGEASAEEDEDDEDDESKAEGEGTRDTEQDRDRTARRTEHLRRLLGSFRFHWTMSSRTQHHTHKCHTHHSPKIRSAAASH